MPDAAVPAQANAAPAQAKAPQVARPALWEVADADTTIYLDGSKSGGMQFTETLN